MLSKDAVDTLSPSQLRFVLDTIEESQDAKSTDEFKTIAVSRLQRQFGCRNITFFSGSSYHDMFYDSSPLLMGDIAHLMDEWVERWRSRDVFSSGTARRTLVKDGFASIDQFGQQQDSHRDYAEGYLRPHHLSDASAILLHFADGEAIIGMFDTEKANRSSDRLAGQLLARHLNYGTRHRRIAQTSESPKPALENLTERQREIAQLVSLGMSNRAIADRLFLTEGAVKKHLSRVFDSCGLSNRSALTAAVLTELPSRSSHQ